MNNESKNKYWKSLGQRDGLPIVDLAEVAQDREHARAPNAINRRQFLEAAGFTASLVALGGCSRAPEVTALPFDIQPEGVVPGVMRSYASTCAGCPAGCGLLLGVRDGRPLKMEGLPEHPLSRGGLCAVGQALPLGLYDSHRLSAPLHAGKPSDWAAIDAEIISQLKQIQVDNGAVRFVTPTVTSPTLQANIDTFLSTFENGQHITVDAASCSAILGAHERTHASAVLPHYHLDKASVIVSFGADFLGTWISPVEFTAAWRSRRVPTPKHPRMSYHVQLEGRMSLTGSKADRRFRLAPDEVGATLSQLAVELSGLLGQTPPPGDAGASPIAQADIHQIAVRLRDARGESVVLCDSNDVAVQSLTNWINQALGNYGKTVDIRRPSRQRQGRDAELLALVEELASGNVAALFVAGIDLIHDLPNSQSLAESIQKVPLVVSLAEREDELSALAHFVCPDHHPLESWSDAEPVEGVVSLSQPTIRPLGKTRSILESLSRWQGRDETAYDLVRATWKKDVLTRIKPQTFQRFWDKALHDGFVESLAVVRPAVEFDDQSVQLLGSGSPASGFALVLYHKIGMTDPRNAHNPWLQELPDPITKVTWDNYVCISPATAGQLAISDGDVLRVEAGKSQSVELPVLIQPGQHDRVVAIALGYGVRGTDRFADIGPQWFEGRPTVEKGGRVGKNVAGFIDTAGGVIRSYRSGITLKKTGKQHRLATTQEYHSLTIPRNIAPHGAEVRDVIEETTLAAYVKNPTAGKTVKHSFGETQLWAEDHPKSRHHWGMSIDLNACTGCSACLIACQSENNVPVVGRDEVGRQREMHWIRLDRYYSGDGDEVDVAVQPMMCQHCDNAPCETVCPVLATVHTEEGLNAQIYNRCVGTRYCANNCPYKVRRFNWFKYTHDDLLQNLALNPDVTVRSRGVMEKCSMCIQRIEKGKIDASRSGRPLADGDIQIACQQSCPARAITFGDLNDPKSAVSLAEKDSRRYGVLEEFNFRSSVSYLRVVRNRDEQPPAEGGHHG